MSGKKSAGVREVASDPCIGDLLTKEGPYADAIAYGQTKVGNGVLDVSIVGGFVFSDTPKNGIAIVVNGEAGDVRGTALDIAERIWSDRRRFVKRLTAVDDAITKHQRWLYLVRCRRQPRRRRHRPDDGFAEGLTSTRRALRDFRAADRRGSARKQGDDGAVHGGFTVPAKVLKTTDWPMRRPARYLGRAGARAGPPALQIGGVTVVCVSRRKQCADPVFFEMHGLDIRAARTVVVKSRGHFRGGFDEFSRPSA